jgi:ATPase subunit of ABC transporter with duplicated ATPase domains
MNGRQFIYHMQGLTKTYPGNRKVLENINLSFYPDAKIGVLGVNGSGKSTLLRIMAGIDKDFVGEGWVAEGATVGYLEQEPQLDAKLSVRDNVMQGVAAKKALLDRYNEIAANYSDETADEMAKLQDEIDSKNLWELDAQVDLAMDALRCPPDDSDVTKLSGGERRRVALCRLLLSRPDLLLLDEPTEGIQPSIILEIESAIRRLREKSSVGILLVEQYLDFAQRLADEFCIMAKGEVVTRGPIKELTPEVVRRHLTV